MKSLSERLTDKQRWALALLVPIAWLITLSSTIFEGDTFWETKAGLNILNGHGIIAPDVFSWTLAGRRWTPNSWGWDVILGLFWKLDGYTGVAILGIVSLMILLALLVRRARQLNALPVPTVLAIMMLLIPVRGYLSQRPQLATYIALILIFGFFEVFLRSSYTRSRVVLLVISAVVQLVSINLHLGGTDLAPVLLVAAVFDFIVSRNTRSLAWSALFIAIIAALDFATPFGVHIVSHAHQVQSASNNVILEWTPGWKHANSVFVMAVGLAVAVWDMKKKRPARAGALVCTVALTFTAYRFAPLIAVIAAPELGAWFSDLRRAREWSSSVALMVRTLSGAALVIIVVFAGVLAGFQFGRAPDNSSTSVPAALAVPAGCKVFNQFQLGGPLILLKPDTKVAFDGRNDFYDTTWATQQKVLDGGAFADQWLTANNVNCVAAKSLQRENGGLVKELTATTNWRSIYSDENWVVFERNQPLN